MQRRRINKDFILLSALARPEKVEGFLSKREGRWLYEMAKNGPASGVIVEIGSYKGKSTIWLALGSKTAGREKVYAVDPHIYGSKLAFLSNLRDAGVLEQVVLLVMTSAEAAHNWDKPVRLLWIDGSHAYEDVRMDFDLWERHLVNGGIIAFHDAYASCISGPPKVVKECMLGSKRFRRIGVVGTIVYGQKSKMDAQKHNFFFPITPYSKFLLFSVVGSLLVMFVCLIYDLCFARYAFSPVSYLCQFFSHIFPRGSLSGRFQFVRKMDSIMCTRAKRF